MSEITQYKCLHEVEETSRDYLHRLPLILGRSKTDNSEVRSNALIFNSVFLGDKTLEKLAFCYDFLTFSKNYEEWVQVLPSLIFATNVNKYFSMSTICD